MRRTIKIKKLTNLKWYALQFFHRIEWYSKAIIFIGLLAPLSLTAQIHVNNKTFIFISDNTTVDQNPFTEKSKIYVSEETLFTGLETKFDEAVVITVNKINKDEATIANKQKNKNILISVSEQNASKNQEIARKEKPIEKVKISQSPYSDNQMTGYFFDGKQTVQVTSYHSKILNENQNIQITGGYNLVVILNKINYLEDQNFFNTYKIRPPPDLT